MQKGFKPPAFRSAALFDASTGNTISMFKNPCPGIVAALKFYLRAILNAISVQ
jgi:hypothetical protein